jgi:hypothetical protein
MLSRDSLPLVVVAHPDPGVADALRHAVEAAGAWRAAVAGPGRDALHAILAGGAAAVVVGCARLGELAPGNAVPLLAIGEVDRPTDLRVAMDAGAAGLLPWPDGAADLASELARVAAPAPPGGVLGHGAVVVAVAGVQGGAGGTTLAAHLAGAWARWGSGPVLLADLAGGLGFRLDLSPTTPTWVALAGLVDAVDGNALTGTVTSPWPGLAVLPLPGLADGGPEPRPDASLVAAVLRGARDAFHAVVLDLPPAALACGPVAAPPEPIPAWASQGGRSVGRAAHHTVGQESPVTVGEGSTMAPAGAPRAELLVAQRCPSHASGGPPDGGSATEPPIDSAAVALGMADVTLMVARPDSAGLTALETADAARAAAGIPAARAGMVVMGASASAPVASREIRARLGDRLWALVPASPAELAAAAEDGLLLLDRPEIPAVQAMLALAHRVIPFTGAAVAR